MPLGRITSFSSSTFLVLDSCCETSRRVFICSETTPNARKPTHARPAPRPNRLVKEVAIQSVESTLVDETTGLIGICCCALAETCTDWSSFKFVVDCGDDGPEGCGCCGGGVADEEVMWWLVLVWGSKKIDEEPKIVAMFRIIMIISLIWIQKGKRKYLTSYWLQSPPYPYFEGIN